MGFWNDGIQSSSTARTSRRRSRSRSRSPPRRRSSHKTYSPERPAMYSRDNSSFFGLPNTSFVSARSGTSTSGGRGEKKYYASRSVGGGSWWGGSTSGGGHSNYSYSGGSSSRGRGGVTNRLYLKLRRFLRDLYYYMRRHPVKVFVLVILPLLTGGALTKILGAVGVRLPKGLEDLVGGGAQRGGERYYSRGGARDYGYGGGMEGMGGVGGMADNVQGLLKVAKMFM